MEGINLCRRDNLESLAYIFMLLINSNKVTWANDTVTEKTRIINKKKEFIGSETSLLPLEF